MMQLHELPEDVLRVVLSFADVYAVISLSGTNRHLRSLATSRLVWLHLLRRLHFRGFVDGESPESLASKTQGELVEIVQRMVLGPFSWRVRKNSVFKSISKFGRTSSSSKSGPIQPSKLYTLHPEIERSKKNDAYLLAGGDYVLFGNRTVECWKVVEDECIWAHEKREPQADWHVTHFAADIHPGGRAVNVIVCTALFEGEFVVHYIDVMRLDLDAGQSTSLVQGEFSAENSRVAAGAKLCGSLASFTTVQYGSSTVEHTLIKLDDDMKPFLTLSSARPSLIALTNEHIVILQDPPNLESPELRLLSINDTKSGLGWTQYPDSPNAVDIGQLSDVHMTSVPFKSMPSWRPPWRRSLHVHRNPLEDGSYRIWIRWGGSLSGNEEQIELRRRVDSKAEFVGSTISYSGHAECADLNDHRIYAPGKKEAVASVALPEGAPFGHLSPYSGAIAYYGETLRVAFFA
ncbi:F-box domain-containing protein [Mycena kentingensis (nom. inval.)]|nr:F-box domain-containing protein [Mycena kentingensis (nom. inval.)]